MNPGKLKTMRRSLSATATACEKNIWKQVQYAVSRICILAIACIFFKVDSVAQPREAQQKKRPNIILLIADDLGYSDIGCYGQQKTETPNIDRLAREGMRFTQLYSGSTVCAPARKTLMT